MKRRSLSPATRARRGLLPPQVVVTVNVSGAPVSERDLADKVQALMLKRAANNWPGGLMLPGRGA